MAPPTAAMAARRALHSACPASRASRQATTTSTRHLSTASSPSARPATQSLPFTSSSRSRPSSSRRSPSSLPRTPSRPFLSGFPLPSLKPQSLVEARVLPYPQPMLYEIIADVDRYAEFLPFCTGSVVTEWKTIKHREPATGEETEHRVPARGELTIGFQGISEKFTSELTCVPNEMVEAVSGADNDGDNGGREAEVFKTLSTRWSLRTVPGDENRYRSRNSAGETVWLPKTEVSLKITYQFKNPAYAVVTQSLTPVMANQMIEAFERRARQLATRQVSST